MSPHGHWDRDLSQAKSSLDKVTALLSEAKKVGALFRPPAGDEKRRPWIAMACLAGDYDVIFALSREAGAEAFCFGENEAGFAAVAAKDGRVDSRSGAKWRERPMSAWHLALMAHRAGSWSSPQAKACLDLLESLPASVEAAWRHPCPEAIVKARPTLAKIKGWSQKMGPALGAGAEGKNLAQLLVDTEDRQMWKVCMGFAKGPAPLRAQLRENIPCAVEMLRARTWAGPAWAQAVEKMAADLEASEISSASKRTKACGPARSL